MFGKMFSISLVLSLLACTAIYQTAKPLPTGHEKPTSTTRVRLDPLRAVFVTTAIYQKAKPLPTGHEKPTSTTRVRLDPLRAVFVTIPGDGEFASVWCLGSGRAVAQAITAAFAKQGIPVYIAEEQLAYEESLLAAARLKAGYVALSVITLWDQRNEWLGRPSSVAVRVSIVDVATGRVIESKPIVTHNRTQLAFTIVGPETLLEKSLNEYVSKFY